MRCGHFRSGTRDGCSRSRRLDRRRLGAVDTGWRAPARLRRQGLGRSGDRIVAARRGLRAGPGRRSEEPGADRPPRARPEDAATSADGHLRRRFRMNLRPGRMLPPSAPPGLRHRRGPGRLPPGRVRGRRSTARARSSCPTRRRPRRPADRPVVTGPHGRGVPDTYHTTRDMTNRAKGKVAVSLAQLFRASPHQSGECEDVR